MKSVEKNPSHYPPLHFFKHAAAELEKGFVKMQNWLINSAAPLHNSKNTGNAPVEVIRVLVFSLGPQSIVGGRPGELRFLPAL